jgi:flagellar basal-body rod protein FlgB
MCTHICPREEATVNTILNDPRITIAQQALQGLARRQEAIAANIANVDTPGYRRKEVPFEAELRAQLGTGPRLATTDPRHFTVASAGDGLLRAALDGAQGRTRTGRNDGNDVDIDYEMTRLAETALRYQLLTQVTSTRFATLKDTVARAS